MKKLLLILLCLPFIGFGQNVNIPDTNFKAYLVGNIAINTNGDTEIQLSEATAFNGQINCSNMNISDLTGIEAFIDLTKLDCRENQITSIDLNSNTDLITIYCRDNQLTSIDVSQNLDLRALRCGINQLTSLNVSANTALISLGCSENQITSIDVSQNLALESLDIWFNQITTLDISNNTLLYILSARYNLLYNLDARNGNNQNMWYFWISNNPNLTCVNVDDVNYADTNWTIANNFIDSQHYFSSNCITQFPGCTDSLACNYDINATVSDSSCSFASLLITNSNVSCNGFNDGSVIAIANGGVSPYQYSLGGGLLQNSGTFSNLTAGTYFLDVTDINGCSSNQIFTITEPNPLFVNAFSTDINCFGYCDGSAFSMPSGGTPPYSYLWSNGNITDNISGLCASAYVVNITDANNCVNIETVVISEPSLLSTTINVTDETAALNDGSANAIVLGGVPPYSYSWSNGSATNPNLNLSPSLYTVDVIDANGCIVSTSVTVNAYTTTDIIDIENASKNLRNITDMLGQETPYRRNTPLFYIYDNGTVEKRIVIE